jgi:hypothetical protein
VTKLLLKIAAVVGLANSLASERSQPPLLIDNAPASATPLDAQP